MGILDLAIAIDNLRFEIDQIRRTIRAGTWDGGDVLRLCRRYRQLGCGLLLADLDVEGFQDALFESARSYLWLLERPAGIVDPYYLCRGRAAPLLDALAVDRFDLARTMAGRMDAPFQERMEAEEDYRYLSWLAGAVSPGTTGPALLAAFERCFDEGPSVMLPSPRFRIAASLEGRDGDAFDAALKDLTEEWTEEMKAQRRGGMGDPYLAATEGSVFVEGVAMVRLARVSGMATRRGLPFIPDEAFEPRKGEFPEPFAI